MTDDTSGNYDSTPWPPEPLPWSELVSVAPRKRGWALIAWAVILLLTSFAILGQVLIKETPGGNAQEGEIELVLVQAQARSLVGAAHLVPGEAITTPYDQAQKTLNKGSVAARLRFITVAGELAGPQEALKQLDLLARKLAENHKGVSPQEAELENLLRRLYQDYAHLRMNAPSLSPVERQALGTRLGWFGELALAPPDYRAVREATLAAASVVAAAAAPTGTPQTIAGSLAVMPLRNVKPTESPARTPVLDEARETFLTFAGAVMLVVLIGLSGCAGLIVFLVLLYRRKLRGGLACGSLHGGIYAETFALWMLLYIGLLIVAQFLPPEVRLPGQGLFALLSLVVLGWPVLRGIPWQQVRQEIGLTAGRQPALEPLVGVGCYAMAFPLVAVGVVVVVLVTMVQQAAEGGPGPESFEPGIRAAHPIVVVVAHGDWWTRLQVLFLASIVAPVVEETMFRGVLYRHLREATCKARAVWSILVSAVVVAFLFAVIHPQGLLGVPLLMGLAFGFILAREWRDCLVPGIAAHALNNTLVLLFAILAFGS